MKRKRYKRRIIIAYTLRTLCLVIFFVCCFLWYDMTAVLVEVGYLSNARDRNNLQNEEYQEIISQEIADAILRFLKEEIESQS